MAAAAAEPLRFWSMSETELRQWVGANPGRVNHRDCEGLTPLTAAARNHTHSQVVWLLDEMGANVNAALADGTTALHVAASLDILIPLLDRGAEPTLLNWDGLPPLMRQAQYGTVDNVARLLQDPRVRATVNALDAMGKIALHWACKTFGAEEAETLKVHLLLQAGVNPIITHVSRETPLDYVRHHHPTNHATIALLEQAPDAQKDAEKASFLVKGRRLVVTAISNTVAPSCLQARVARGQPLPRLLLRRMMLTPMVGGPDEDEEGEEGRKLHSFYVFLFGLLEGPRGRACHGTFSGW